MSCKEVTLYKGQRLRVTSTDTIFSNEIKVGDTCIVADIKKGFVLLYFERAELYQLEHKTSTSHLHYTDIPHTEESMKLFLELMPECDTIHAL